jgi:hypothetical protein
MDCYVTDICEFGAVNAIQVHQMEGNTITQQTLDQISDGRSANGLTIDCINNSCP